MKNMKHAKNCGTVTDKIGEYMSELVKEGRRLVTVRKIDAIDPIDGADMIEAATVDGWQVVVKKNEFEVGQYCVFFEIDSFLPADKKEFAFLAARGTKTDDEGRERCRLRTIKLKGVVSQGLALPVTAFESVWEDIDFANGHHPDSYTKKARELLIIDLEDERDGIEQFLDVTKYERPSEKNGGTRGAKTGGEFPIVVPKTDEERIQNIFGKYSQTMKGVEFRKSLKMEGSSHTIACFLNPDFFLHKLDDETKEWNDETNELVVTEVKPYPFNFEQGQVVVASRNQTLKYDPASHFWIPVLDQDLPRRLYEYCVENDRQLAIQSEVMGPGIQGNIENFDKYELFTFRVWDIDKRRLLNDEEFQQFTYDMNLQVAPQGLTIKFFDVYTDIKSALASAEHKSINAPQAEGDVYKSVDLVDGKVVSFKVINNKYLLKEKD